MSMMMSDCNCAGKVSGSGFGIWMNRGTFSPLLHPYRATSKQSLSVWRVERAGLHSVLLFSAPRFDDGTWRTCLSNREINTSKSSGSKSSSFILTCRSVCLALIQCDRKTPCWLQCYPRCLGVKVELLFHFPQCFMWIQTSLRFNWDSSNLHVQRH